MGFLVFLLGGRFEGGDDGLVMVVSRGEQNSSMGRKEKKKTHLIEDVLELVLRQRRALDVLDGPQLLGHALAVLLADGRHALFLQLIPDLLLVAEIDLRADDEAGYAGAMMVDFGEPFLADVLKGRGGGDAEADEEDVGLRVRERTETVVVFLAGGVEEAERVGFVADPGGGGGLVS